MDGICEERWTEWKRKRRNTFIGFLCLAFLMGLDLSAIFTTLFIYLSKMVPTAEPKLYYSLTLGSFNLSSLISCVTFGRWLDNTRKVRTYANVALVVQLIGYIIYSIPFHPAFIVVGRIFNGLCDPSASVVSGELFRLYDETEGVRANFWLTTSGFVGVLLGPTISALARNLEFHIGAMTVNYLNFPGVFLAGLMLIGLVLVNYLIHDCSAEIDLKEYLRKQKEDGGLNSDVDEHVEEDLKSEDIFKLSNAGTETIPIQSVIKCFAANPTTIVIFLSTFFVMYSVYSSSVMIPLIIEGDLKWDIRTFSGIIVLYGISGLVIILILGRFLNTNIYIYYMCVFSIATQGVACGTIALMTILKKGFAVDITLLSIELSCLIIGWFFTDTVLKIVLSKMVPSRIQSFSECLRAGATRCAIIIASFVAPNIFPWLPWWACGMFSVLVVLVVCFVVHRKQLIEPGELCFEGYQPLANNID